MEQQYLQPQVYVKIIQELSATIGNLHTEMALQKVQYEELLDYTSKLQEELDDLKEPVEKHAKEQGDLKDE